MIIQLSLTSLHSQGQKVNEADNAEGATLLQLIIFKYYNVLNDEMWNTIYTSVVQRMNKGC